MGLNRIKYFSSNEEDPYERKLRSLTNQDIIEKRSENILLIVPPSTQEPTPGREFLITGPFEGFTYIATLIKKLGFILTVYDSRLKEDPYVEILKLSEKADLICIATFCDSFSFLEEGTKKIKSIFPEKPILLGGPLITSIPETIMKNTSSDFGIHGEAELTLIEFLESFFICKSSNFSTIKGLVFKNGSKVQVNPPRPQIKDLDNLPFLDYKIWPNYEEIIRNGQILISSTRGCPYNCSFCFKTIPTLRFKTIERFEEEVSFLKQTTNFNYTWLNDLNFNVNSNRAMQICDILKKYEIKYHVFANNIGIKKDLMFKLKDSGCLGIWFGIESYDQNVLDYNFKGTHIEEINSAIMLAQEADLAVRGLFIVGLYGETEKSLEKMTNYIEQSSFIPLVKYLVPFPGTSAFQYALKKNKITNILDFLRLLSRRRIRDNDDEIINITDMSDEVIRKYFHEVWKITKARGA